MSAGSDIHDWRISAFEAAGVDLDELERRMPGIVSRISDNAASISARELISLLEEAAQLTGNADLGIRLATESDFRKMDLYGFLVLDSPNVAEMFRRAVHYYPILYRHDTYSLTVGEETAVFSFNTATSGGISMRIDNEWALGAFVNLVRSVTLSNWTPRQVSFTHSAPKNMTALRHFFGTSILFDQPTSFFELEVSLLEYPLGQGNHELSETVRRKADLLLADYAKNDSFEAHVRLLIIKNIGAGKVDSGKIALELGVSRSTLKRRLAAIDTSYRTLLRDIISHLAKQALSETETPVTEIALRLGYSELSSFDRNFRRTTGMTPGEYREKAKAWIS